MSPREGIDGRAHGGRAAGRGCCLAGGGGTAVAAPGCRVAAGRRARDRPAQARPGARPRRPRGGPRGLQGVGLVAGDLFDPLGGLQAAVDLVVSNPPYIATAMLSQLPREVRDWEPREGLDGGPDGMAVHRRLIAESPGVLRRGGWLLMEMGERRSE